MRSPGPERIMVVRSRQICQNESLTMRDLTRMAQGKMNWRLEQEGSYEGVTLYEVWESEETDAELSTRIKREQRRSEQKARRAAKKLDQERALYQHLKQKFDS